ncbi:MAG: hypothetical protein Q8R78_07095 [Candidatus Omnitrophota bacterium]|nr:hypothetical protein [Candidatus Omnitrophota bacterium]
MTQKPTPEEKLFAVIQGARQASPRARVQAVPLAALTAQLQAILREMDLPRINRGLSIIIIVLAAWCLLNPLLFRPRMDRVLAQATKYLAPFVIAPPLEGLKPSDEYVALMRTRDPFRVGGAAAKPRSATAAALPAIANAQAMLADFKLVGISKGTVPRAMVEQVSQQTTHVLTAGDPLGPFTVKEVLEDRVLLQLGTEKFELF